MLRTLRLYAALEARYLKPHWFRVVILAVLLLVGTGLSLVAPLFIRYFIDTAREQGELRGLYIAALLFLATGLASQASMALTFYVGRDVAWRTTNRLRFDLLLHVVRLDMSFHNSHTPGELIQRIDGDVSRLANFFSALVVQLVGGLLLAAGVLVVLSLEDWRIGVAVAAFAVAYLIVHTIAARLVRTFLRRAYQAKADLDGWLGERYAAVKDIRTSGAQEYEMNRYFEVQRRDILTTMKGIVVWRGAGATSGILSRLGVATAMGLGLYLFRSDVITVGTVYLIIHYLELLQWPLQMVSREVEDLQRAAVSIERVNELFDTMPKVQDGDGAILSSGPLGIEFDDVSFGYQPETGVLHNVSFRLEPGRVLGLLGRTGSGKTTLSRLLFRLYEADEGAIHVGGRNLTQTRLAELRRRIGMVTQEVQLFHASVRDNLTLFDNAIDDNLILETLHDLGLEAWYRSLGDGLDTELSSGGEQLSAGEAQLLAFARVFLRNPDVVILDEASSRLDPATEALIERAVSRLLRDRTGIVIAHRLATLQQVDDIIIIEDGRIQEHGEREALARDGSSRFSQLLRTGLEEVLA